MNDIDVVYTMWENLHKTEAMEVGQVIIDGVSTHISSFFMKVTFIIRSVSIKDQLPSENLQLHFFV